MAKAVKNKKKAPLIVDEVLISVHSTFNNTILTASIVGSGDVIGWTSSGQSGFKGAKKGTPYAATSAMKVLLDKIAPHQPKSIQIRVVGAGNGRDAALRAIAGSGYKVSSIADVTPLPHNGTRPKKARRV
ncbi:MAG: 30S ribosomal protein S11 [Berkelbacteria bacterium GW2011_GWA2_46_7]|uniref:Small ribosomal subunit protein uS11 n=1 Tax=Berkelbacteria bacterium GW2011_GWA2_46_7 TaxID=1618335 RepID=A0A0G1QCW8_9BACT|nr:MAG: 30S ribosomal protein S11 [Berkelbacteria bacterium GW2011_GWA2_46_7]